MSFIVNPPFSGGTLTGPLTLPAGSLANPSLLFTGAGSNTGFYSSGANNISLVTNGNLVAAAAANIFYVSGAIGLVVDNATGGIYLGPAGDVVLRRDAAQILAQRNGTNAQTFKVYGTTDSGLTNYERLAISAQQGVGFTIGAETLGTGADNLSITLAPAGNASLFFPGSAFVDTVGNFVGTNYISQNARIAVGGSYDVRMGSSSIVTWTATNYLGTVDFGFGRNAAGVGEINNGTAGTYRDLKARNLITNPGTFAALVAAATAGKGARAFINDGAGAVFGVAAAGGGALNVPVYSDGTNWIVG